jgi:hypothetical protein
MHECSFAGCMYSDAVFRIVTRGRVILPTSRFAVTVASSEAMKTSTVQDARANRGGNGATSVCTQVIAFLDMVSLLNLKTIA